LWFTLEILWETKKHGQADGCRYYIQAAIRANLSAEVGDVLRERLAQMETLEKTLEKKEKSLALFSEASVELHRTLDAHDKLGKRKEVLDRIETELCAREEQVYKANLALRADIAEIKMVEAAKRAADALSFLTLVFGTPTIRKHVEMKRRGEGDDGYMTDKEEVERDETIVTE